MDPNLEPNKPLAREIVRRLMDAWRLKRAYKYRSEKRVTHRKLYLSLMKQLMHEIGQRNLHDIIMQRIVFFNHNFLTTLEIGQFQDLMSHTIHAQSSFNPTNAQKEIEKKAEEENKVDMENLEVGEANENTVRSTDALRSLSLYQYDPEQDNKEILSNIQEIEKEDEESLANEKDNVLPLGAMLEDMESNIESTVGKQTEDKVVCQEENVEKADIRSLFSENEMLKAKLEPMLVYRDDPDMYDRLIAPDIRGKKFKVSNDGRCPRCHYQKNVFVILDFLFPMGDMPEICNYLIAKGQAVLWSSQDDSNCKDPPTILCRGRCPADPSKCGFNLNWNRTDLESVFFFPHEDNQGQSTPVQTSEQSNTEMQDHPKAGRDQNTVTGDDGSIKDKQVNAPEQEDENETEGKFVEGYIDMQHYKSDVSWVVLDSFSEEGKEDSAVEEQLIKTMLALSSAKEDWEKGVAKLWSDDSDDESSGARDQTHDSSRASSDQQSKEAYTFSWNAYGSNPWAPTVESKKKALSSESKSVMAGTGNTHVPIIVTQTRNDENDRNEPDSVEQVPDADPEVPDVEPGVPGVNEEASRLPEKQLAIDPDVPVGSKEKKTVEVNGSSSKEKKHYTAEDYPVSKDGSCPYCKSTDVVYIIIDYKEGNDDVEDLPEILKDLLDRNFAYKMPKDDNEPPSFQCLRCTYGFNLDWGSANLETIFSEKLQKTDGMPADDSSSKNESGNAYDAANYGYQMPHGSVYSGYYPPQFMGFYPAMGYPVMPYAAGFFPPAMPGYFPAHAGYLGYMPGVPNKNHPARLRKPARFGNQARSRNETSVQSGNEKKKSGTPLKTDVSKGTVTMGCVTTRDEKVVIYGGAPADTDIKSAATILKDEAEAEINREADVVDKDINSSFGGNAPNTQLIKAEDDSKVLEEIPAIPGGDTNISVTEEGTEERIENMNSSEGDKLSEIVEEEPLPPGVTSDVADHDVEMNDACVNDDLPVKVATPLKSGCEETAVEQKAENEPACKIVKFEETGSSEEVVDEIVEEVGDTPRRTTRSKARGRGRGRGRGRRKTKGKS